MTSQQSRSRARNGIRLPLWALGLLILLLVSFLVGSSIWLYRTIEAEVSHWNVTDPEFGDVTDPRPETAVTPGAPAISISENPSQIISAQAFQPWKGEQRVSILLLGVDRRCDEEGPTHSDSLMLVSLDPVTLSAVILSLPRDLWVEIPTFGVNRINQAYYNGQIYEYPGGGQALARETVANTLGVPVDYYVAVDFQAFVEMVDLIGGIEIEAPEAIDDPTYPDNCYGYEPFSLDAGLHQLDGATALKYARTRATFGGDVDRAGRQQEVVMAIRDKVLRLNMLPQLIRQAPQIWQTVQQNVRTNLSLDEIAQLALLAQDIPQENIRTAVIDYDYVINQTTPDGRQVLVPIREELRKLRDDLFTPPPIPTPAIVNLPELMQGEGARVAVYNGTTVFGLAGDTQTFLRRYGVNVTEIGNADAATYRSTQIIDYGAHPNTTSYLVQLMQMPPLNVSSAPRAPGDFDVLIILGSDWQVPAQ